MKRQIDVFYQAVLTRDYRFDGKFFVGVKTTGVYCRPICPAKPHKKNIEFFADALAAERAGYRPCLRCRPECAPLSPAWNGRSAVVQRALKLIATNGLAESNEDQFARKLGVTARHLRRLFDQEIGKTPKQIWSSNRLDFARKLISETQLPITEVAFSSGFSSIRRFNDAFKLRFHRSPSEIRKSGAAALTDSALTLKLPYRPPFDWQSLLKYYKSHEIGGVENITEEEYQRIFRIEGVLGFLTLRHLKEEPALELRVETASHEPVAKCIYHVVQNIRQMFDLDSDPLLIANHFSKYPFMRRLIEKNPGLRMPRGFDPFETAISTILGQLVSMEQARRLTRQLVENYGDKVISPGTNEIRYLFPTPKVLATCSLAKVGTTRNRKQTIREFSKQIHAKKIELFSAQDPEVFRRNLMSIKGIGLWTAEYISLRALGDTDAFPRTDLILNRIVDYHKDLDLNELKPWRGYVAIHLWKEYAEAFSKKSKSVSYRSRLLREGKNDEPFLR